MSVFQKFLDTINIRGGCYVILIDPDKKNDESIYDQVEKANRSDVDAIFIGGSLMMDGKSNDRVEKIKQLSNIPIVLFPGGVNQINAHYNAARSEGCCHTRLKAGCKEHYCDCDNGIGTVSVSHSWMTVNHS